MSYLLYEAGKARLADIHREAEAGYRGALARSPRRRLAERGRAVRERARPRGGLRIGKKPAMAALAALVCAVAISVPAANAMPIDPPGVFVPPANISNSPAVPQGVERTSSGANPATQSSPASPQPSTDAPSKGFDWGDAGIGAAGAIALLGLGAGGALIARRTRRSHATAS